MNAAMARQLAAKFALTNSPDWGRAQELAIAEREAEHAHRDAELKAQEAESRAAYEAKLKQQMR